MLARGQPGTTRVHDPTCWRGQYCQWDQGPQAHRVGKTHTHMYAPDLRGAHRPSQTGAYKLARSTLSFQGGTKKSHPEQ
jgi:hypothetical protein